MGPNWVNTLFCVDFGYLRNTINTNAYYVMATRALKMIMHSEMAFRLWTLFRLPKTEKVKLVCSTV